MCGQLALGVMSMWSLPVAESAEQGNARKSVSESRFKGPVQLRRSSREKQPSKGLNLKVMQLKERGYCFICARICWHSYKIRSYSTADGS